MNIDNLRAILDALPDPAFILSQSGKYVAIFGGRDSRYYHDGSALIGSYLSDVLRSEKTNWFLAQIQRTLELEKMQIVEYELSNKDIKGLSQQGPDEPIWFEGRIQPLDFTADNERLVLWVACNISDRHKLEAKLRYLSHTDQLTGLFNRRRLEHELSQHFANFQRYQTPTSLLMLDLDNLKLVNDSYGHHTGDELINTMAEICKSELRETDIVCRFGGDEFVILLPNTSAEEANAFAERLREVFTQQLKQRFKTHDSVSVSIGVTCFKADDNSHQEALHRADKVLYQAKDRGKNQVASV